MKHTDIDSANEAARASARPDDEGKAQAQFDQDELERQIIEDTKREDYVPTFDSWIAAPTSKFAGKSNSTSYFLLGTAFIFVTAYVMFAIYMKFLFKPQSLGSGSVEG